MVARAQGNRLNSGNPSRLEPSEMIAHKPITPVSPDITEQVPRIFMDMSSTSLRSVEIEEAGPSRVSARVAQFMELRC